METIKYIHRDANTDTETEIELPVGDAAGTMHGVRNAGPRDHRSQVPAPRPRAPRPYRPTRPRRTQRIPAGGGHQVPIHRDEDDTPDIGGASGDVIAIPKTWLADGVTLAGQAWAAFLQRPERPEATGDAIKDANNASLHRDALQRHDDNKDKIRFVGELVGGLLGRLIR